MAALVGDDKKVQTFATMLQFILIALPFCMKRRLNDLRHVSLIVVMYCVFVSICVVVRCTQEIIDHPKHSPMIVEVSIGKMMDIAPVAAFGFSIVAELFA